MTDSVTLLIVSQEFCIGKLGHFVPYVHGSARVTHEAEPDGLATAMLKSEVERLRGENALLRERLALIEGHRFERTTVTTSAATAARSAKAAKLDAFVFGVAQMLSQRTGLVSDEELRMFSNPDAMNFRWLRRNVAEALNKRGFAAPRGGRWTPRQILRALERHSRRVKSDLASPKP